MPQVAPKQSSFAGLFVTIEYEEGTEVVDLWDVYYVIGQYKGEAQYYQQYIVPENKRITEVSNKFYGTPNLWWFILIFNDIVDPFSALQKDEAVEEINQGSVELDIIREEFLPEIFYAIREAKLRR